METIQTLYHIRKVIGQIVVYRPHENFANATVCIARDPEDILLLPYPLPAYLAFGGTKRKHLTIAVFRQIEDGVWHTAWTDMY